MKKHLSVNDIELLLYQNEGTSIDFKVQQYPFEGATDEQKSELLKDILAFTNAWRREEAFILIGVKTEVGAKHTVIGCDKHFDDAQLQQFVNSKIDKKKITLSYEVYSFESKKIGIIRIPKQERPIYVNKDFGKVKKEVVYYRLGSSTAIARPEDIYKMGKDDFNIIESVPVLDLQFAEIEQPKQIGHSIKLNCIYFKETFTDLKDARYQESYSIGGGSRSSYQMAINRCFWRDSEEYTRLKNLLKPCRFVIYNSSSNLAKGTYLEINCSSDTVCLEERLPKEPSTDFLGSITFAKHFEDKSIEITTYNGGWSLMIKVGDIKPKVTCWLDYFFIGSKITEILTLEAKLYGDNLSQPQIFPLIFEFSTSQYPSLTINRLREIYKVDKNVV